MKSPHHFPRFPLWLTHGIPLAIACFSSLTNSPAQDAAALVAKLDAIRLPSQSFIVTVKATETDKNGTIKPIAFRLYAKAAADSTQGSRSLVVMTEPEEDKGKLLLLRDNKAWFLDPPSRTPTVLSAKQLWQHTFASDTLTGTLGVSYTPVLAGRETIATLEGDNRECLVLDLTPTKSASASSETRRYWLTADGRPWQLWYFTPSGSVIRKCRFGSYKNVLGQERPTRIEVAATRGSSQFQFTGFQATQLPDALFESENLANLSMTEEK